MRAYRIAKKGIIYSQLIAILFSSTSTSAIYTESITGVSLSAADNQLVHWRTLSLDLLKNLREMS